MNKQNLHFQDLNLQFRVQYRDFPIISCTQVMVTEHLTFENHFMTTKIQWFPSGSTIRKHASLLAIQLWG